MSRNFELLQQAGRLPEVTESRQPVEASAAGMPVLEMTEAARDEVTRQPVEASAAGMPVLEMTEAARDEVTRQPVEASAAGMPVLEMTEAARDEVTKLVNRLFLISKTEMPRSVVFTATEAGNGCSWVCARVGELLASLVGGSVCLVDSNPRNPNLHQQFGLQNHTGFSDALGQNGDIRRHLRPLSLPNLWLLNCGSAADRKQAFLASDRMRTLLQELRTEFDYVIVDAGPLEAGTAIVLCGATDGAVVVLKANRSRRDFARIAMQEFEAARIPILGVVLNRRTFPIPEAIYKRL